MGIELLEQRASQSRERVESLRQELKGELDPTESLALPPSLCIYATGSLARLEATEHSDLDAFFLLSGGEETEPLGRIRDIKILRSVIKVAEEAGFPDFSNEGKYLSFLHLDDMLAHIGGRGDDYHNAFTGRVLMILEGRYLYNEHAFTDFRGRIVETYFKDFHDHSRSFRPIFLLNDVLRFWRTLCINYENSRHWRQQTEERSAKGHLDNLKLRFSRLNICYSFICHLLAKGGALSPEDVVATADLTPIERLCDLRSTHAELAGQIDALLDEYAWFCEAVGHERSIVLKWISNEENRIEAFRHGADFAETMVQLVRKVAEDNGYLRYLVI